MVGRCSGFNGRDYASRCIVAAQLFTEATSENAVVVLQQAIGTLNP